MKIDVTILMPCLNEATTILASIGSAKRALEQLKAHGLSGEILISDNGSDDGSQHLAETAGARVVRCPEKGYGNALIYGANQADGKFILMGDSDASYDFCDGVAMILKLREGYEICMGSRFKGTIMPGAMPWKNRYLGNPVLTGMLNLFYRSGFSDAHCGLRAFTKEAFRRMKLRCTGMEFASEMVIRAAQLKLKGTEVPITLHKDGRDRPPHLNPWRDGKRHVKFMLMYGPLWLFFLPASLVSFFAVALFTLVSLAPAHDTFKLGRFAFGDHWMILGVGMFSVGFQGLLMGAVATSFRAKHGLSSGAGWTRRVSGYLVGQHAAILGSAFIAAGFGIIAYVVWDWAQHNFGALYRFREVTIATTLLATGIQAFFGVVLVSVLDADIPNRIDQGKKSAPPSQSLPEVA